MCATCQAPTTPAPTSHQTLYHTAAATAAAKLFQSCLTQCDPIDGGPPGSPGPWDSPGKNTGVGCHFLLQCMKLQSESEVAQSCPTLSDPMDCSLPGSSIHGIFQVRVLKQQLQGGYTSPSNRGKNQRLRGAISCRRSHSQKRVKLGVARRSVHPETQKGDH